MLPKGERWQGALNVTRGPDQRLWSQPAQVPTATLSPQRLGHYITHLSLSYLAIKIEVTKAD